jgi:hypothetical protein
LGKLPFILTRFTHGSAGKFLSTVLQTSDQIDHWSVIVQSQKDTDLFESVVDEYVRRSFPCDHTQHLRLEPMVPYNTDMYSTGFSRGNDVTLDQYLTNAHEKRDVRLFECIKHNRIVNLIFHKPTIPLFCRNSKSVTITVTTDEEKQWLFKTLWIKHFLETKDSIRILSSDPEYCNFVSLPTVLKFANQYIYPISDKEILYQTLVLNDPTNSWYFDPEKFIKSDKENNISNVFIKLSDMLDKNKFLKVIPLLFEKLELEEPNLRSIESVHNIWLTRQL